jgi:CRP/FNR family transcriptional regulator
VPFFAELPATERSRVAQQARVRTVGVRERVWMEGEAADEFVFVARGRVKLAKAHETGRDAMLDACAPGSLLCALPAQDDACLCCDGVAMEDETVVVSVPRRVVFEMLERCPAAVRPFVQALALRTTGSCRRIEELSSGSVERRLGNLLLRLAEQVGLRRDGSSVFVPVRLSRQDLADLVGTTIETAIRVMSRLGREGLVSTERDGFTIPDVAALRAKVLAPGLG